MKTWDLPASGPAPRERAQTTPRCPVRPAALTRRPPPDLGPQSHETDFGGTINDLWRTAPLWGVGSGFPWHHDGQPLTLHDSILRHGGEAAGSRQLHLAARPRDRNHLIAFLRRLVRYDIESGCS